VHITEKRLAFPYLDVEETVVEEVFDVLPCRLRIDERAQEFAAVFLRKLENNTYHADETI
jgi:hypothetical protein